MATIKISDLRSTASIGCEEFIGAVENAVTRALDARQLQNVRGGLEFPTTKVAPGPILVGLIASPYLPSYNLS